LKTQTKGILITLLAAACFGAASPIAKAVYQYDVTVGNVLLWRFIIATTLVWGYLLFFRKDLNIRLRKDQLLMMVVVGGVTHFLTTQCYFNALRYVPICIQIMIFYTYPFIVNIFSVIFFKESISRIQVLSLIVAFIGILMTVTLDDLRMSFVGIAFCVWAAICNTAYILCLGKRNVLEVDSIVVGAYSSLFAGISYFIFCLARGELRVNMPLPCWTGIIAMAVFTTAVGAIALSLGVKMIGSAKAAIVSVFEPIEAILLGVLIFQEEITLRGWVGIILVIGSIVLVNYVHAQGPQKKIEIEETVGGV